MRKRIGLISLPLFFVLSAQVFAHDLTFFGGYINPGKLTFDNVQTGLRLRGSGVYGARFETDFHRVLGMEHTIAFSPNFVGNDLVPIDTNVKGFIYNSNLVVNVPVGHIVPYATAGLGLIKPFGSDLRPFDSHFAVNYGGGVKLQRLAGPVGLRFDVRGYSMPNLLSTTLNIFEVSGGISFTFGKH